jgi:fatty acid desaturase
MTGFHPLRTFIPNATVATCPGFRRGDSMTYWQGLLFGGIGWLLGSLAVHRLPKDSGWWPVAVLVMASGGALFFVSAGVLIFF